VGHHRLNWFAILLRTQTDLRQRTVEPKGSFHREFSEGPFQADKAVIAQGARDRSDRYSQPDTRRGRAERKLTERADAIRDHQRCRSVPAAGLPQVHLTVVVQLTHDCEILTIGAESRSRHFPLDAFEILQPTRSRFWNFPQIYRRGRVPRVFAHE